MHLTTLVKKASRAKRRLHILKACWMSFEPIYQASMTLTLGYVFLFVTFKILYHTFKCVKLRWIQEASTFALCVTHIQRNNKIVSLTQPQLTCYTSKHVVFILLLL